MSSKLRSWLPHITVFLIIVAVSALVEFLMGRQWICKCGYVSLWYGDINGPGNSQHIADWYSFSHFIHGFVFYGFLHLVARKLPMRTRLILAVLLEAAWEIFENTPYTIDRYRTATIALDYYGDSILNSMLDIVTCAVGFLVARKLPLTLSITLIIVLEVFAVYFVRDNLTLNIIMLVYPLESIKDWQAAAALIIP